MFPFLALAALLIVNAWATRLVLDSGDRVDHKGLFITAVWIVPFFGAFMVGNQVRNLTSVRQEEAAPQRPAGEPESGPVELTAAGAPRFDVMANLALINGLFPVMDWSAADEWLASIPDEASRRIAREDCQRAWLLHLRDALGPHFSLHESERAFVLSSLEPAVVEATARYVATARSRVSRVLGALAKFPEGQKSIVVVFDHEEDYYHYVAGYYPGDGEFAFSSGMFIDAGCPHFVVRRGDLNAVEPVIAHELAHGALAHLRLPLWLDEGLAVNTEHKVAVASRPAQTPAQLHAMHLRFWGDEEIQQFWTGESFRRADDGNQLSYDLARIMVEQMARSWAPFEAFVQNASREDAGAAAAREHLDVRLGAFVCALMGREPADAWEPTAGPSAGAAPAPSAAQAPG